MSAAAEALDRFVRAVDAERLGAYGVVVRVGDERASHRWRRANGEPALMRGHRWPSHWIS